MRFNSSMAGSTVALQLGKGSCPEWTELSNGRTRICHARYVGPGLHANGSASARALGALREYFSRLVETWKSDATSPSPRKYFAPLDHRAIRPPSFGAVDGLARISRPLRRALRLPRPPRNAVR